MKLYIAMMYLLAMVIVLSAYKVATISILPFVVAFSVGVGLLIFAASIIYAAECVREIKSEMDKEVASEIKRRVG